MAVNDTSVIDLISLDAAGRVVLSIADHLLWEDSEHFKLLKEKLNTYCQYVETGQLYDEYEQARDASVRIILMCTHAPNASAVDFLASAKSLLEAEGLEFEWQTMQSPH